MMVLAIVVLGGAYLLYGRYLEKKWGLTPKQNTGFEMEDGGLRSGRYERRIRSPVCINRRCRSDQRTDPGSNSSDGFRFCCGF